MNRMKLCSGPARGVVAAGGLALVAGVASAQSLFAVGGFDPFGTMSLYRVDTATGATTLVGDTGVESFIGIAWTGTELVGLTTGNELYAIDRATGNATLRFNQSGVTAEGDLASKNGFVFASTTGGFGDVTDSSVTIDTFYDQPLDFSGLAAISTRSFLAYATNAGGQDELWSIDLLGNMRLIGATGTQSTGVGALDFDANNTLYLSDGSSLYTVDTTTGAATAIGGFGVSGVSGIAFVPAPGVAAVFGVFGLAASRRRRG